MPSAQPSPPVAPKDILYLTDFSPPSEAALPFAISIARKYGAKIHALHVSILAPYLYTSSDMTVAAMQAELENACVKMKHVDSKLAGLEHETIVEKGMGVWPAVERAIKDRHADLIVMGTRGRTGVQKFLLGSVAEEIFRRSLVPVLTVGPGVRPASRDGGEFRLVFLATDLKPESIAAAPYALSLAQRREARLILLHVKAEDEREKDEQQRKLSAAETIHRLHTVIPEGTELSAPPEVAVEYGEPAERIVEAAKQRGADLIVMGVRDPAVSMGMATHLGRDTAHKVVAHAPCPVLTVRG